jgi:transcriptional regulatory protein LevR
LVKRKLEVEAEEEEAIEPEVMVNTVETLEELEGTEVVIEREVTEEEAREASEEEEVETEAARSQKMTRSNNHNLKSELRTPLPRSEITDLRNFLISSNTTNMK